MFGAFGEIHTPEADADGAGGDDYYAVAFFAEFDGGLDYEGED